MKKSVYVVPGWIKASFKNSHSNNTSRVELINKAEKVYGGFTYNDNIKFNEYLDDLIEDGLFVEKGNLLFQAKDFFHKI